jgi:glycosyltransferase involved in cell wall biosynthesis
MQSDTLVTVICTCFNHEKFVIDSLKSVLNQSYEKIQLIVVDDFSVDNSVSIIENFIVDFPEIIFIKNDTNLGITKSFNNAMLSAKGSYIIDLSADDILLIDCIENQTTTFKKSSFENLAMVYGNAELIHENGNHHSNYFELNRNSVQTQSIRSGDIYAKVISPDTVICSVAAMYKRSVYEALSGYDERLDYEDFDFWLRVSRNYDIEYIDQILVQKRIVPNSLHDSFSKSKKIGKSVHLVLKTAYKLNKLPTEHKTLKKRIHNEIKRAVKNKNINLLAKNLKLWLKASFRSKI